MFSTMHHPVYRDDGLALNHQLFHSAATASSPYRPTVSSPLSSSPVRASTPSPPPPAPLSPLSSRRPGDDSSSRDIASRDVQSSPIPAPKSLFKFATHGPPRPTPLTAQKREAAQESRRKLFLKNVRQRAEDKRWERRGGEQEVSPPMHRVPHVDPTVATRALTRRNPQLLKLEWSSLNRDLQQARNADLDGVVFDSDIEDAAHLREEVMRRPPRSLLEAIPEASASQEEGIDADAMMVDMFEQEQAAELEALVSSMAARQQQQAPSRRLDSSHWSDDEDYDALFMDYLSQEQQGQNQAPASSGDMDLS